LGFLPDKDSVKHERRKEGEQDRKNDVPINPAFISADLNAFHIVAHNQKKRK